MKFRYFIEFFIGFLTILAILIWGSKGMVVFALIALIPIIMWIKGIKPDERELALLHNTNSASIVLSVIIFFLLYFYSGNTSNTFVISNWWKLAICSFVTLHGGIGLFHLKYK